MELHNYYTVIMIRLGPKLQSSGKILCYLFSLFFTKYTPAPTLGRSFEFLASPVDMSL